MTQNDRPEPAQNDPFLTSREIKMSPTAKNIITEAWRQGGWRQSTLSFSIAALVTFLINLSFTIWASVSTNSVLADSDCKSIKILNTGLHVLVNILSTILLAGSNYCMQCLSAPTRSQVDAAHKSGKWLDIGVSSLRNVFTGHGGRSGWRVTLWFLLGISSLPLHLLYNSAVFQSLSMNTYGIWLMSEGWIESGNIAGLREDEANKETLDYLSTALSKGALRRLSGAACLDAYSAPFQSTRSHLILVTGQEAKKDTTPFGMAKDHVHFFVDDMDRCGNTQAYQWMCNQYQRIPTGINDMTCAVMCDELLPRVQADVRNGSWMPFFELPVEYCYSLPTTEHCKLQVSKSLLIVVTTLNLFKAALILACVFGWRDEPPLLTVGDAIASFVDRPDVSTEGVCLLTRNDVDNESRARKRKEPIPTHRGIFEEKRKKRGSGASGWKWTITVVVLLVAMATCIFFLYYGIRQMTGQKDMATLFGLGLGAINTKTVFFTTLEGDVDVKRNSWATVDQTALLQNAVVANTPQLIFSLVYFTINGLFTTMCVSTEWSRFGLPDGRGRKGLRRSADPKGKQRSTYFLGLPYRFALPLIVFSGGLHWLISQSLFLVFLENYTVDLNQLAEGWSADKSEWFRWEIKDDTAGAHVVTCGWSPVGVVASVSVGLVLLGFLVGFGYRRLPSGMPVAGSCSLAISAACHPPSGISELNEVDLFLSEKPLQWGETAKADSEGNPGHCSFSAGKVAYPTTGEWYL